MKKIITKQTCSNCDWYSTDQLGDGYCVNYDSYECSNFVEKENHCKKWERKKDFEIRNKKHHSYFKN